MMWMQKFGGRRWRVTPEGVETDEGLMRTPGEPVTARRLLRVWGHDFRNVSVVSRVPIALLMMTALTEGGLRWTGHDFDYPRVRREPGYLTDDQTPNRVSYGPMHVLLSTYRDVMYAPEAGRLEAGQRLNNLLAGALYIAATREKHDLDPILCAATYNAGGVYDASQTTTKDFVNPWHIRSFRNHLDRAARWYGDSLEALAEDPPEPLPPKLAA